MPFTTAELQNIAASALDFYYNKGESYKQTVQAKPLLDAMVRKHKKFSGGKGDISLAVQGNFGAGGVNDTLRGFTHDDQVNYMTPANVQRVNYPWREHFIGLSLTRTEMLVDGISITDPGTNGTSTTQHSGREMHVLEGLFENKLADLGEQSSRGQNALMYGDGTADPKAMMGLGAIIAANPTVGTLGGLSRVTNTWWRNRARTAAHAAAGGTGAVTSNTAGGGALIQALQAEHRQLIRFGGKPDLFLAGSDFLGALETEIRANGNYSMTGFSGRQDTSVGGITLPGGTVVQYDPSLDTQGTPRRAYWIDTSSICLMAMSGEWGRTHRPSRPPDRFVVYVGLTYTGQMVATRVNSSLVIDIT